MVCNHIRYVFTTTQFVIISKKIFSLKELVFGLAQLILLRKELGCGNPMATILVTHGSNLANLMVVSMKIV
jgi:hypothetical protein